jgi:hypothetical protein
LRLVDFRAAEFNSPLRFAERGEGRGKSAVHPTLNPSPLVGRERNLRRTICNLHREKEVAPKIIDMAAKFNAPYVSFQSV